MFLKPAVRQPFLNSIFNQLSAAFPLAGVLAYMTFAVYLLFASGVPPCSLAHCPNAMLNPAKRTRHGARAPCPRRATALWRCARAPQ